LLTPLRHTKRMQVVHSRDDCRWGK
jgi:hypothetical protein